MTTTLKIPLTMAIMDGMEVSVGSSIFTIPIQNIRQSFKVNDSDLIRLESGELSYCLFVDELLGEQQVVVKPLPSYLSRFNIKQSGIAGCTILGDGNISIILDISNLYTPA